MTHECPNCGAPLHHDDRHCQYCKSPVEQPQGRYVFGWTDPRLAFSEHLAKGSRTRVGTLRNDINTLYEGDPVYEKDLRK